MTTQHEVRRAEDPQHDVIALACLCGWRKTYRRVHGWGWRVIADLATVATVDHLRGHGTTQGVADHRRRNESPCELCREVQWHENAPASRSGRDPRVRVNATALRAARQSVRLSASALGRLVQGGQSVIWGMEAGRNGSGGATFMRSSVENVAGVLGIPPERLIQQEEP